MKTYKEKLLDPRWQKKRLKILERDNWTCQRCQSKEKTLNVHHICYINGQEPWEADNNSLTTLCQECHKYETENKNKEIDHLVLTCNVFLLTDEVKNLRNKIYKKIRSRIK